MKEFIFLKQNKKMSEANKSSMQKHLLIDYLEGRAGGQQWELLFYKFAVCSF
jgi:hypothetical protein